LAQIDRIEVLRGPGSSLYGADAVGGVVQIFTKRGEGATRLSGRLAAGEYGAFEGALSASGAQGGFDYAVSLSGEGNDGISTLRPGDLFGNYNSDKDGYSRKTAQARLGYEFAPGHRVGLQLMESRLDAQFDGSEYPAGKDNTPDFHNKLDTQVASMDYTGRWNAAWTTRLQLSHNDDDLHSGGNIIDRFHTRRDQFTGQAAWSFLPGQQLIAALEHIIEKGESTSYREDVKRDNDALVLAYSGQFGPVQLQADLRRDDNSVYGGTTTGRLGGNYELAPGLRLRALYGSTYRAPSFNDLYFPGYGVATITPEHGRSAELGLSWRDARSEASATVYRNKVRDLIGYEPDSDFCPTEPAYDFGCARNISRAKLQGATLAASHRLGNLRLSGVIDFLDATDEQTGARLTRRAAHQESFSADYTLGAWRLGAALLSVGARPDGSAQLASYTTLDLKAAWRLTPTLQIEAKLLNATDRDYQPARDYQSLGRQAWIAVRYDGLGL
ncbi:MAG TPA: TonB-dependent receptor, partial [Ideonella sp.]|nr:TonB-dependent receptor [Ideonella sp.]